MSLSTIIKPQEYSYNLNTINLNINDSSKPYIQKDDCNLAIQSLNFDIIQQYFETVANYYSKNKSIYFISLGSGFAQLEYKFKDIINWICIDPNPTSFNCINNFNSNKTNSEPYIKPSFKTVQELLSNSNTKNIVSNCVLLLNWMPPSDKFINENQFEKEAIELLKPLSIISLFEKYEGKNGSAGGYYFHSIFDEALDIKNRLNESNKSIKQIKNVKYNNKKWKKIESKYNYRINNLTFCKHKGNKFRCDTVYIVWLRYFTEKEYCNKNIPSQIESSFYNNNSIQSEILQSQHNINECVIC